MTIRVWALVKGTGWLARPTPSDPAFHSLLLLLLLSLLAADAI